MLLRLLAFSPLTSLGLPADYVQPICSPTRSALMTGRYTIRLGTQSNVLVAPVPWGVALTE